MQNCYHFFFKVLKIFFQEVVGFEQIIIVSGQSV